MRISKHDYFSKYNSTRARNLRWWKRNRLTHPQSLNGHFWSAANWSFSWPRHLVWSGTWPSGRSRYGWILVKFCFFALVCGPRRSSQSQCKIRLIMPARRASHIIKSITIWLAPRAGKMNQIARCDWLDGAILPARDYPLYPACKISPKPI